MFGRWRLHPRPHRHDQVECWCELKPEDAPDHASALAFARTIAMTCEHGAGFLDECECWSKPAIATTGTPLDQPVIYADVPGEQR